MGSISISDFNPRGKKYYLECYSNNFCYESMEGICSLYLSENEVIKDNKPKYFYKCNINYCRKLYKKFTENKIQDSVKIILKDCNHYWITEGQHMLCSAAKNGDRLEVVLEKEDGVCDFCSKEKNIQQTRRTIKILENEVENSKYFWGFLKRIKYNPVIDNDKNEIKKYELKKSLMYRDFSSTVLKKSENKLLEEYKIILDFINNVEKDIYEKFNGTIEFQLVLNELGYDAYINYTDTLKELGFRINLNFKILYENRIKLLGRYSRENSIDYMTDKELSEKLKEIQKLKYTRIEALYITPTGTGVGSEVVKILINRLKEIKDLKYILLYPASKDAERFWRKQGFTKTENKLYDGMGIGELVLEF
ncbi:GNAT family N-acetyltransferase [Clostridium perfringens]|uniref:GNAT family N-acetyltransferase n=1 Tax=Clostridium perfringens TaxID=1502 RepID=UPI0013E3225E|nr:GNAT family N-acetyltransferase [Clostridium perfringens]NGU52441.1 GNAT family N-acetyltransferase [Clostridium perfringens]